MNSTGHELERVDIDLAESIHYHFIYNSIPQNDSLVEIQNNPFDQNGGDVREQSKQENNQCKIKTHQQYNMDCNSNMINVDYPPQQVQQNMKQLYYQPNQIDSEDNSLNFFNCFSYEDQISDEDQISEKKMNKKKTLMEPNPMINKQKSLTKSNQFLEKYQNIQNNNKSFERKVFGYSKGKMSEEDEVKEENNGYLKEQDGQPGSQYDLMGDQMNSIETYNQNSNQLDQYLDFQNCQYSQVFSHSHKGQGVKSLEKSGMSEETENNSQSINLRTFQQENLHTDPFSSQQYVQNLKQDLNGDQINSIETQKQNSHQLNQYFYLQNCQQSKDFCGSFEGQGVKSLEKSRMSKEAMNNSQSSQQDNLYPDSYQSQEEEDNLMSNKTFVEDDNEEEFQEYKQADKDFQKSQQRIYANQNEETHQQDINRQTSMDAKTEKSDVYSTLNTKKKYCQDNKEKVSEKNSLEKLHNKIENYLESLNLSKETIITNFMRLPQTIKNWKDQGKPVEEWLRLENDMEYLSNLTEDYYSRFDPPSEKQITKHICRCGYRPFKSNSSLSKHIVRKHTLNKPNGQETPLWLWKNVPQLTGRPPGSKRKQEQKESKNKKKVNNKKVNIKKVNKKKMNKIS